MQFRVWQNVRIVQDWVWKCGAFSQYFGRKETSIPSQSWNNKTPHSIVSLIRYHGRLSISHFRWAWRRMNRLPRSLYSPGHGPATTIAGCTPVVTGSILMTRMRWPSMYGIQVSLAKVQDTLSSQHDRLWLLLPRNKSTTTIITPTLLPLPFSSSARMEHIWWLYPNTPNSSFYNRTRLAYWREKNNPSTIMTWHAPKL